MASLVSRAGSRRKRRIHPAPAAKRTNRCNENDGKNSLVHEPALGIDVCLAGRRSAAPSLARRGRWLGAAGPPGRCQVRLRSVRPAAPHHSISPAGARKTRTCASL